MSLKALAEALDAAEARRRRTNSMKLGTEFFLTDHTLITMRGEVTRLGSKIVRFFLVVQKKNIPQGATTDQLNSDLEGVVESSVTNGLTLNVHGSTHSTTPLSRESLKESGVWFMLGEEGSLRHAQEPLQVQESIARDSKTAAHTDTCHILHMTIVSQEVTLSEHKNSRIVPYGSFLILKIRSRVWLPRGLKLCDPQGSFPPRNLLSERPTAEPIAGGGITTKYLLTMIFASPEWQGRSEEDFSRTLAKLCTLSSYRLSLKEDISSQVLKEGFYL
ncbi:hypothetical protein J6590_000923 [Homalodisca vitripennis]|nr:hypothetical protein J6590_000923 [Homalodisca vitripennis]